MEPLSSTTAGSRCVRLFWPTVAPRGSSLRSASRAAADIIRITQKKIKLSQNRKLSKVDPISCACDLALRLASSSSFLVSLLYPRMAALTSCTARRLRSRSRLNNWPFATCRLCVFNKVLAMLGSRYRYFRPLAKLI
jgi:hypothetical protein